MKAFAASLLLMVPSLASAETLSSNSNGFEVRESLDVRVDPPAAFAGFARIGSWWSGDHTFSGDAANLRLDLRPGGCFCEALANGGGVQHMVVTYIEPGKRIVLTGSLGPLLFQSTTGVMDIKFEPLAQGTRVVLDYRASGFFNGGADGIAPAVDSVLGAQLKHFGAYLERRR